MSRRIFQICLLSAFAMVAAAEEPAGLSPGRPLPGYQKDHSVLLPNQWSLRPTGTQVELENFPVNVAVRPQGDFAAVLHSGYGPHVVSLVDLTTAKVVSSVTLPKTFYGICFGPRGAGLFVSGGESNVVYHFKLTDRKLVDRETIKLQHADKALAPTGLACSADSEWLYTACCLGHSLRVISLQHPDRQQKSIDLPAEIAILTRSCRATGLIGFT